MRGFSSAVFRPAFSDPAGGPSESILFGLLRRVSAASSHLHLLPLLLGNEKLPGLGPLEGPHIAPLLQLVHKARGTGVAQLQAPLEHGRGRLTRLQDDLHGGGKELVLLALLGLGGVDFSTSFFKITIMEHGCENILRPDPVPMER